MSICAPNVKNKLCYSKNDLIFICKQYNKHHKDKIRYQKLTKNKIFLNLKDRLKNSCNNNHSCWLEQKFIPENFVVWFV